MDTGMSRMMGGPCEVLELLHYRRDGGAEPRITVLTEEGRISAEERAAWDDCDDSGGTRGGRDDSSGILLGMFS